MGHWCTNKLKMKTKSIVTFRWNQMRHCQLVWFFGVIHGIGNVNILYCLNSQNYTDIAIVISRFNLNIKYHEKCKFGIKMFPMVTCSNLFSLEVVQNTNISMLHMKNCIHLGCYDIFAYYCILLICTLSKPRCIPLIQDPSIFQYKKTPRHNKMFNYIDSKRSNQTYLLTYWF